MKAMVRKIRALAASGYRVTPFFALPIDVQDEVFKVKGIGERWADLNDTEARIFLEFLAHWLESTCTN